MVKAIGRKLKIEAKLKKNLSKNRKKGWRKNVEIEDVEEFIEDERLQLRTTGELLSEKPEDELFVVERKSAGGESFIPLNADIKQKKSRQDFKCYDALKNPSKIQVPIKPNKSKPAVERYGLRAKATLQRKKEVAKLKKLKTSSRAKVESKNMAYDLWADSSPEEEVDEEIVKHFKRTTNTEPIKVPCYMFQKSSLLPAVEVPQAGASYNPSYEDHQELLMKAHDVEVKKLKGQQSLKRALDDHFPTKKNAPNQATWLEEMSQGLHCDSEDSGVDEDEAEAKLLFKNPPVHREQRKLRSKKRKEKVEKIQKKLAAKSKEKKIHENEIFRVKQIKKEITEKEALSNDKSMKRSMNRADKLYRPARIGQYRYENPDMEVVLTDELKGSLRQLKPQGDLLEDRFKSFQRRNVLQTSVRQKTKRKYKLKKYFKKGHKVV